MTATKNDFKRWVFRLMTLLGVVALLLAFNPAGMAAAQEDLPVDDDALQVHVVQAGETLYKIGQRYDIPFAWIVAANNIPDPSRIEVGQQLIIPASEEEALSALDDPNVIARHIVQRGEYLSLIAQRYGVSSWVLAQVNGITNPSLLYVGQVLTIAYSAPEPVEEPTPEPTPEPSPEPTEPPPADDPGTEDRDETYTVQSGDTLGEIARQYTTSIYELASLNGIVNANLIHVGMVLTIPPIPEPPQPTILEGKQIVTVLSAQRTYAFEDGELVAQFVVSTGLPATPTVQGEYAVYLKLTSTRMRGPGYDLPGVPWTMYFYQGYAFHGTYWHNNFGQPMSHGCVNMRTPEAQWLFEWSPVGTPVLVLP